MRCRYILVLGVLILAMSGCKSKPEEGVKETVPYDAVAMEARFDSELLSNISSVREDNSAQLKGIHAAFQDLGIQPPYNVIDDTFVAEGNVIRFTSLDPEGNSMYVSVVDVDGKGTRVDVTFDVPEDWVENIKDLLKNEYDVDPETADIADTYNDYVKVTVGERVFFYKDKHLEEISGEMLEHING